MNLRQKIPNYSIPLKTIIGYSIGSLGTGIFSTVPGLLLLYFMTNILAVPAALASIAIFAPKIWDVITDPLMGIISDRTRCRWGRRQPYLLAGSFLMGASFMLLFSVPNFNDAFNSFLYVTLVFTLCATSYTIFAVPYISMPTEMTKDPHERTILMSWRMGSAIVGIMLGGAGAPLVVDMAGGGRTGYAIMSVFIGVLCGASMLVSYLSTRNLQLYEATPSSYSVSEQVKIALRNRPFFLLMGAYILQLMGIGCFSAALPFFAVDVLSGSGATVTLIFFIFNGAAVLSMPVWVRISRSIGKVRAYMYATLLISITFSSLSLAKLGYPETIFYSQIFLAGLFFSGQQLLPFSLLPDAIDIDAQQCGMRREGMFTGIWTAGEKTGLAFGGLLTGLFLSLFGYIEAAGQNVAQPDAALFSIRLAFSLVPAFLLVISAYFIHLLSKESALLNTLMGNENS